MVMASMWSVSQLRCLPAETRCSHQDGARGHRHSRCLAKGDSEINHDKVFLSLLETAQNNSLKLNPDKIEFKTIRVQVFLEVSPPR